MKLPRLPAWRRGWTAAGEVLLTVAAVAGLACVIVMIVGLSLGVRPFIDLTGSMQPAIPARSLILTERQPASTAHKGDIVGVDANGTVIVHRVVSATPASGGQVSLVLKGDANSVEDAQPYLVSTIYHPIAIMPVLGKVVFFFTSWIGSFVLGITGGALVTIGVARWSRSRPGQEPEPVTG